MSKTAYTFLGIAIGAVVGVGGVLVYNKIRLGTFSL
jgi:hypothetical protein